MAKSIVQIVSFSAGEWSPTLSSRVDQEKYRSACLRLRNMLALKTGPATRRPGTEFMAKAKQLPDTGTPVWVDQDPALPSAFTAIAWSPTLALFAAVSSNGVNQIMTSPDGISWTARATPITTALSAIIWGGSQFVAVGPFSGVNQVLISPDGITWTEGAAATTAAWRGLAFGNGTYVAVGGSTGDVMTSPDGATWTAQTTAAPAGVMSAVKFGGGTFVAVASTGEVMTSLEGAAWTLVATIADPLIALAHGTSKFAALGQNGTVYTSPDGAIWTKRRNADVTTWRGMTFGNGFFAAVGSAGPERAMSSVDAVSWTYNSAPTDAVLFAVAAGVFNFSAVGSDSVATTLPADYAVRMQDFQFSVDTTFALEFGNRYVRFYSNGAQVNVTSAPLWIPLHNYYPGDYVEDPSDGLIYFNVVEWIGGSVEPNDDDGEHWIQQTILEVPTPYGATIGEGGLAATEVFQLQFCALNDTIYIAHPLYPMQKLVRRTDESWSMKAVVPTVPALLDQNATDTTISADAVTGTTILSANAPDWVTAYYYEVGSSVDADGVIYNCLVAHVAGDFYDDLNSGYWEPVAIFKLGHIGSYWELSYLRDSAYVEYIGTPSGGFAAGVSETIVALGDWEVRTYGVWSADVAIQASRDGGITWQQVRQITGRDDRNANIAGTAAVASLYRIVVSNVAAPASPGATAPRIIFECVDAFLSGIVQITEFGVDVAAGMVSGTTYQILTLGSINWGDLGARANFVAGSIFSYNGTSVTGSGGTVTTPYRARGEVLSRLPTEEAWVSGLGYNAEDRVGYNEVNYVAVNDVASSTPPPSDPTNWAPDGWPTTFWSEGAWSELRGYPRAVTAFQQRLWAGFTAFQSQRVWGSKTGDLENNDLGDQSQATDAVAFDLDATNDGSGVWLQGQDALFAGFVGAEWVVMASDATQAIGPTSVTAHRQSRWGSNKNVAGRVVGDALVFVQRQGYSVRQMLFSIATNKYMSQDLTGLSDQILNAGAVQLAYQQLGQKNGFLWATTANGEIVAMTYELDQEVFGWSRHFTGVESADRFESVAVLPGKDGDDDEVYVVVRRTANGAFYRYVERIDPTNWYHSANAVVGAAGYPADKNSAHLVDSGVIYRNPPTNVLTGLAHLNGRTVAVAINGADYGRYVVAGGTITVDNYESPTTPPDTFAHVGLPFESLVQPMNIDADPRAGGTQGLTKKVTGLTIALYDTLSCKFSDGSGRPGSVRELVFKDMNNVFAEIPLFSGNKEVRDFPGDYGLTIPVVLFADGPLPLTVLSIAVDYGISGSP